MHSQGTALSAREAAERAMRNKYIAGAIFGGPIGMLIVWAIWGRAYMREWGDETKS